MPLNTRYRFLISFQLADQFTCNLDLDGCAAPLGVYNFAQLHTSFSLYAGRNFVEVLTKCRVQYLLHGDARFVDARRY
jgi:hypothetical protein